MYNTPTKKPTLLKVSKQDITTKTELPGAKLAIKDANGKTIATWTSGTTAKYVEGLMAGNYSFCELEAPAGYILNTKCIDFTLKNDGTTTSVIMYNQKKPEELKVKKVKL